MATQADVRRIAMKLPGTREADGHFAFEVPVYDKRKKAKKMKGFVWVWKERVDPKKARIPNPKVLAARTASLDDKEILLSLDQKKFFTEPHYNGFPAILIRLPEVTTAELRPLITEAWRCMAPPELLDKEPKSRR